MQKKGKVLILLKSVLANTSYSFYVVLTVGVLFVCFCKIIKSDPFTSLFALTFFELNSSFSL